MNNHKDLDVWRKSVELVVEIYRVTEAFPKKEIYGITNQIRRASVSIPSNIAEGAGRKGNVEFSRFLYFSLGSLSEVETQLIISKKLKYLQKNDFDILNKELTEIRKMLLGLIKSLR